MKLSYSQIGSALGISKQAVGKLAKQGMPTDSIQAAKAWRVANLDVSRIKPTRQGADVAPPSGEEADDAGLTDAASGADDYRTARTEREQIRRDLERLELQRQTGELVDAAEVSRLRFTEFRMLRDALFQIGQRIAPVMAVESDPIRCEQIYTDELSSVLTTFADQVLSRGLAQDVDTEDDASD